MNTIVALMVATAVTYHQKQKPVQTISVRTKNRITSPALGPCRKLSFSKPIWDC